MNAFHTKRLRLGMILAVFCHSVVSIRPIAAADESRLEVVSSAQTADGKADQWHNGQVPVTGTEGDYGPGWAWYRHDGSPCHFQADWPLAESGWYKVELTTDHGRTIACDAIQFEADGKMSQEISCARLQGPGTLLVYQGYVHEMPRNEIVLPFAEDHWWYPQHTYWRLQADFHGERRLLEGGNNKDAALLFREF